MQHNFIIFDKIFPPIYILTYTNEKQIPHQQVFHLHEWKKENPKNKHFCGF